VARFYVDADVAGRVASLLRSHGHEVEYVPETENRQRSDPFHMRRAASQNMVLLTFNSQDFRSLHRLWKSLVEWEIALQQHLGILTATRQVEAEPWVSAIEELMRQEDVSGKFFTWLVEQAEWRPDRF